MSVVSYVMIIHLQERRAVCYDETVYPTPHVYDPERFLKDGKLDPSVKDPEDRVFGTGRRYVSAHAMVLTLMALPLPESVREDGFLFEVCSLTSLALLLYSTSKHQSVKSLSPRSTKHTSGESV